MNAHLITALALLLPAAPCLPAQEQQQQAPAVQEQQAETVVGKALAAMQRFATEKRPDTHARYYIYLQSAGWCGPCNREMPQVVQEYREMQKHGVEIIFVSCDKTPQDAAAFMKRYGADFACIGFGSAEAAALPGYAPERRVPRMSIVDAAGRVVVPPTHAGQVLPRWREHTHTPAAQ